MCHQKFHVPNDQLKIHYVGTDPNTDNIITKQHINDNLDILINNLENFESHMVEKTYIHEQKYVIDKYHKITKSIFIPSFFIPE